MKVRGTAAEWLEALGLVSLGGVLSMGALLLACDMPPPPPPQVGERPIPAPVSMDRFSERSLIAPPARMVDYDTRPSPMLTRTIEQAIPGETTLTVRPTIESEIARVFNPGACGDLGVEGDFSLSLRVTVGADSRVTSANVSGAPISRAARACLESQLQGQTLAAEVERPPRLVSLSVPVRGAGGMEAMVVVRQVPRITTPPPPNSIMGPSGSAIGGPAGQGIRGPSGQTISGPSGTTIMGPSGTSIMGPQGRTIGQ